ncbi:MAG: nucleotide exchange factor GrpE [Bacteroidota bacterium]|nr:nucleotide exchange factor GrpE [Bacteroidota bacterium]
MKIPYFKKIMQEENTNNIANNETNEVKQDIPAQPPVLSEVDTLGARIVELENTVSHYKDQLLRKAAEFDNYKKRIENDYANLVKFANENLIEKLLPVLDDFERSFKAVKYSVGQPVSSDTEDNSFQKGIEMIYNKFKRILELEGVKPLEVLGQPFDPQLHDALLQIQNKNYPPHTVLEEVEKGYMLHDKILRHAKVIVSAEQIEEPPQTGVESEVGE